MVLEGGAKDGHSEKSGHWRNLGSSTRDKGQARSRWEAVGQPGCSGGFSWGNKVEKV